MQYFLESMKGAYTKLMLILLFFTHLMSYVHFWILTFKQTYFIALKLIGSEKERKLENKKDMKKKKKNPWKQAVPRY